MNLRSVVAALAGAVVAFLLGYVVYEIVLMPMMAPMMVNLNTSMDMVSMFLGTFLWAWALAMILEKWDGGVTDLKNGALVAAIFGVIFSLSIDLSFGAMFNIYTNKMVYLYNAIGSAILWGGAGAAIAIVRGKMSASK